MTSSDEERHIFNAPPGSDRPSIMVMPCDVYLYRATFNPAKPSEGRIQVCNTNKSGRITFKMRLQRKPEAMCVSMRCSERVLEPSSTVGMTVYLAAGYKPWENADVNTFEVVVYAAYTETVSAASMYVIILYCS